MHTFTWVHEHKDGNHVLIQAPTIRSIELIAEGKTRIFFTGDKDSLDVRETPEEILDSLTDPPERSLAHPPGDH